MLGQSSFPEKQEYEMLTQQSCRPQRNGLQPGAHVFVGCADPGIAWLPCSFLRPKPCSPGNPA